MVGARVVVVVVFMEVRMLCRPRVLLHGQVQFFTVRINVKTQEIIRFLAWAAQFFLIRSLRSFSILVVSF